MSTKNRDHLRLIDCRRQSNDQTSNPIQFQLDPEHVAALLQLTGHYQQQHGNHITPEEAARLAMLDAADWIDAEEKAEQRCALEVVTPSEHCDHSTLNAALLLISAQDCLIDSLRSDANQGDLQLAGTACDVARDAPPRTTENTLCSDHY